MLTSASITKGSRPHFIFLIFSLVLSLVLTGCAKPGKRTGIGAGTGAVYGAAVGGIKGGKKGALVGAAVGATAGAAVGNYLDKQARELQRVADTKRTQDGILVNLKNDLLFETNSFVLKDEAIRNLSELGDILAKYKDDRIRIEGHTDNTGSADYNETLSLQRAEAVKEVLQDRGVSEEQIIVLGRGETEPVSNNQSSQGRAKNRRVELHIDVPGEKS